MLSKSTVAIILIGLALVALLMVIGEVLFALVLLVFIMIYSYNEYNDTPPPLG